MTIMRKEIAISRDIKPPMMKCSDCGALVRSGYPKVSVRSLIFALQKIEVISGDKLKEIDRDWKRYQKKNDLDGYGKKKS